MLTSGSIAWKVNAVVERPSRPASNFMVGTHRPKSRPAIVEATNPGKVPVTASVTAPAPAAGPVQRRVLPLPVHAPAAAVEDTDVAVADAATVEDAVAVAAAYLMCQFQDLGL